MIAFDIKGDGYRLTIHSECPRCHKGRVEVIDSDIQDQYATAKVKCLSCGYTGHGDTRSEGQRRIGG